MGLISGWQRTNRQNKGQTDSRNMGYKVQDGDDLRINVGGDIDDNQDKATYLQSVRAKISTEDINKMIDLANVSQNLNIFFATLEQEGIPLVYLIAMDVDESGTIEEDIQSYQTLKAKGIDMNQKQDTGMFSGADESYIEGVVQASRPLPRLKSLKGKEIKEVITGGQKVQEDYQSAQNVDIEDLRAENADLKALVAKMKQYIDQDDDDAIKAKADDDISGDETLGSLLEDDGKASGVEDDDDDVEDEADDALAQLQRELLRAQKNTDIDSRVNNNNKDDVVKGVYIVGKPKGIDMDNLEDISSKYEFIAVQDVDDLNMYATNKNNLLILTPKIKASFVKDFKSWLKGVQQSGERYRMVTLQTDTLNAKAVEDAINLTEDDLDKYYSTHPLKDYTGTGIADFKKIGHKGD